MAFSMGLATSQQPHARSHWLRPRSQTCHPEPREGTQSLSVTKLALKPVPRLSLCVYHACYWPAPVRPRAHTHAYKSEWAGSAPPRTPEQPGMGAQGHCPQKSSGQGRNRDFDVHSQIWKSGQPIHTWKKKS